MIMTRLALAIGLSLSLLLPLPAQSASNDAPATSILSAEQAREENAYTLGVQAYLWGFPLYFYDVTGPKSLQAGAVGMNTLRKYSALKTAKDRTVVTPNNVTIDAYARFDVSKEPLVVHVPALTEPRWYLTQIGNTFDEVTHNIGGIKGAQPGDYLITGPDFHGTVPREMTQVPSRTKWGVIAVRIFANGEQDVAAAIEAQKGFQIMPLSAYLRDGLQYKPSTADIPVFNGTAPEGVRFFDQLGHAMQQFMPASGDQDEAFMTQLRLIGLSPDMGFDWRSLDEATLRGLTRAVAAAQQIVDQRWKNLGEVTNGWRYFMVGGRAGHDYAMRAALAKNVIGAQLSEQVLYPNTQVDDQGSALDGKHKYVMQFAEGQQPPASLFWNLSMYGADMLFVENAFGRYSIGSMTAGLKPAADGSLTLLIQQERPSDTSNWLPAPAGPFNLTMRFYGPGSSVLDGSYRLPAIKRVD
ncbi:DUF1214 domain-containing protein [Pseudomonas sp. MAG733B]|uniref:DUF1254 domain-containing protein n=1 Tax=Pseudomonas sp. MAG733B TaxID=3122079 RepID=UPI0030CE8A44